MIPILVKGDYVRSGTKANVYYLWLEHAWMDGLREFSLRKE